MRIDDERGAAPCTHQHEATVLEGLCDPLGQVSHAIAVDAEHADVLGHRGEAAGAAAQAVQRLAFLAVRQQTGAPVVEEHHVELLGAIHFGWAPRAIHKRGIHRQQLAGGAAGQHPQQHPQVAGPGDHLLHAHAGDVEGREAGPHVGVALVGDHHHSAGLGDGEVHAGEAGAHDDARAVAPGQQVQRAPRAVGEIGAVLVVSGGISRLTETSTLYIFRSLDDRNYVGANGMAVILAALSFLILIVIEFIKNRSSRTRT